MVKHLTPSSYTLRNLHEVPPPNAVDWWPQTLGWHILFALIGAALLTVLLYYLRRWWQNRYRREALAALQKIRIDDPKCADKVYQLHKMVLTYLDAANGKHYGAAFLQTLNLYERGATFDHDDALGKAWLESLVNPKNPLSQDETKALIVRAKHWLRYHHNPKERVCFKN